MTDHQATLAVVVMLVVAVLIFAGIRSRRKGAVDDVMFVGLQQQQEQLLVRVNDLGAQLEQARQRSEQQRAESIAREDALRANIAELRELAANLGGDITRLRIQVENLGAVPVV